jgi:arylsulfatase A-like enzyme
VGCVINFRIGAVAIALVSLLAHRLARIEAATPAAAEPKPPNILLIVSDDQGYGDYGFMGHPHIRTPNLDELAARSMTFRHGYVPCSVCRPSLVSILTGQYPHQHRITSNDPPLAPTPEERQALRERQIAYIDAAPTLPRLLAEKGYVSLQTGKWWEGDHRRGGFTHGMTHGDLARKGRHGDEGLQIGRDGIEPIRTFLDETAGRPFFIWYAPMLPHLPHNAPERFKANYRGKAGFPERMRYWAMCEWFDETCGEVLDELDDRGLTENTIVAYVTDNGWISARGTHQQAPRSKLSPYDGGLRTPIMISWPGRIAPQMVDTPVSSIDLAPTLLRLVGMTPTAEMTGVNLLDAGAVAARKTIFGETFAHEAVDVDRPESCLEYRWCVSWPWKLIRPNPGVIVDRKPELYNVADDPEERRDLAGEHPDVVGRLSAELDALWTPDARE